MTSVSFLEVSLLGIVTATSDQDHVATVTFTQRSGRESSVQVRLPAATGVNVGDTLWASGELDGDVVDATADRSWRLSARTAELDSSADLDDQHLESAQALIDAREETQPEQETEKEVKPAHVPTPSPGRPAFSRGLMPGARPAPAQTVAAPVPTQNGSALPPAGLSAPRPSVPAGMFGRGAGPFGRTTPKPVQTQTSAPAVAPGPAANEVSIGGRGGMMRNVSADEDMAETVQRPSRPDQSAQPRDGNQKSAAASASATSISNPPAAPDVIDSIIPW